MQKCFLQYTLYATGVISWGIPHATSTVVLKKIANFRFAFFPHYPNRQLTDNKVPNPYIMH